MTYSIDISESMVGYMVWHLGRVLGICGQRKNR